MDKINNSALIVEGGGFKSAFTAGILDTFIINKFFPFHLHLGISGGAMNLTSYISHQYKRNIKIISSMSENTNFISIIRFLKGGNYVDLKYLLEAATKKYPFNADAAEKYMGDSECKVVVTNYNKGTPEYLSVKKYGWFKTMEATGSLPIATRAYCEIAGKKYIDGGLSDPLPVKRAYEWGYKNIVLLRTNPIDIAPNWNIESLYAPFIYKDNPKLQNLIVNNSKIYEIEQKYISNHPRDLNLFQIAPSAELRCGIISNKSEDLQMDYRHGLESGLDAIPQLMSRLSH